MNYNVDTPLTQSLIKTNSQEVVPKPETGSLPLLKHLLLNPNSFNKYFILKVTKISKFSLNSYQNEVKPTTQEYRDKTVILLEIADLFLDVNFSLAEELYEPLMNMIFVNLDRPTNPLREIKMFPIDVDLFRDIDSSDPDPSWEHIEYVYEIFLKLLNSNNMRPRKLLIKSSHVTMLISLLAARYYSEREYVKQILHRIYSHILLLRSPIRQAIRHAILSYVYEHVEFNGMRELIEITTSFVSGFAHPLKFEHVEFFSKVLLSLYKPWTFRIYSSELLNCVTAYINKDPNLILLVFKEIFRIWPKTYPQKEIDLLRQIIELIEEPAFVYFSSEVSGEIFIRFCRCLGSDFSILAQTSLDYLLSNTMKDLLLTDPCHILPLIYPILIKSKLEASFSCKYLDEISTLIPVVYNEVEFQFKLIKKQ